MKLTKEQIQQIEDQAVEALKKLFEGIGGYDFSDNAALAVRENFKKVLNHEKDF